MGKGSNKTRMVFILAASSLDHALETLTVEEKTRYKDKIYSIPGLSLNPNTKNPQKIVQTCLQTSLLRCSIYAYRKRCSCLA